VCHDRQNLLDFPLLPREDAAVKLSSENLNADGHPSVACSLTHRGGVLGNER
jgi:hypothetical protein